MPLRDKAKAAWPLRAVTLKQQAMITRRSGKAASGKRQASLKPALVGLVTVLRAIFEWISSCRVAYNMCFETPYFAAQLLGLIRNNSRGIGQILSFRSSSVNLAETFPKKDALLY